MPRPSHSKQKSRRSPGQSDRSPPQPIAPVDNLHFLDDDAPISFKFAALLALAAATGAVGGNILMRSFEQRPFMITVTGAFSTQECDRWVKEGPKASVKSDESPHMNVWWLCRVVDNPCEAKGGHQQAAQIFRKLAFDLVAAHGWDLGANAQKKAQGDLQILRYGKSDPKFRDMAMEWHVESGPPSNASHPTARWTRVLSAILLLSPPYFYSGGEHQIGDVNLTKQPGTVTFYLPGAPTRLFPIAKGEMWAAVWHLWMPSAFDSDALQGYRRTLVEPALSQLARKKRLYGPDRAAFNRFYGDLLFTEKKYTDSLQAYLNADAGADTDRKATLEVSPLLASAASATTC